MSARPSQPHPSSSSSHKTPFFQQRDALVHEIAISLEEVLQNINKLNRSLEGVIAVGNEFGAVEALWSQFEGVMTQEPGKGKERRENEEGGEDGESAGAGGQEEEEEEKGDGREGGAAAAKREEKENVAPKGGKKSR